MTLSLGIVNPSGDEGVLTTESPSSHYGIPVLRIGGIDYGPADPLPEPRPGSARGRLWNGAFIVEKIGKLSDPQSELFFSCQLFLKQWNEGPQI